MLSVLQEPMKMRLTELCVVLLVIVVIDCQGHLVSADYARKHSGGGAPMVEQLLQKKPPPPPPAQEKIMEKHAQENKRTEKKKQAEKEKLEAKALKNMSEGKIKEMNRKKKEEQARAEMKNMIELKRLEKKIRMRSDAGMATELKNIQKGKHVKKNLLHHKQNKNKFTKSLKELHHIKDQTRRNKKIAKLLKELKESNTFIGGKDSDETILKHAPLHMKHGKTPEERRTLKKLRKIAKKSAIDNVDMTQTKSVLRPRSHQRGRRGRHSEEDTDNWDRQTKDSALTNDGGFPREDEVPVENAIEENYLQPLLEIEENGIESENEIGEYDVQPLDEIEENGIESENGIGEYDVQPLDEIEENGNVNGNGIQDDIQSLPESEENEIELLPATDTAYIPVMPAVPTILTTEGIPFATTEEVQFFEIYSTESVSAVSYNEPAVSSYSNSSVEIVTMPPVVLTTPGTAYSHATERNELNESILWPWTPEANVNIEVCGKSKFGRDARMNRGQKMLKILEGKEALPGSFPWQVAILDSDRDLLCGGSLIAPRWVLTAAHCIRKKLFVRLSEHHIHQKDGYEIEQKVRRIFKHPDFNSSTIDSDIALLRLPALPAFPDAETGIISPGTTNQACLPAHSEDNPPVGTRCMVMGWGKASMTNSFGTDVLMYTRLPVISRKACIRANRKTITENMFCAGHYKGGSDTCSGDSGGPLLCSVGTSPGQETWTVYGVTSFGDGCGNAGKMGVYAKVNQFLDWMSGIMSRY